MGGVELRCCENIVSMLGGNEDIKKLQQSNRKVWTVMEQRTLPETLIHILKTFQKKASQLRKWHVPP